MKSRRKSEVRRLGPTCRKIGSGATPLGGETVYQEEGVSLIRSQNVYNGLFEREGLAHISDVHAAELLSVTVAPNDILLNITGDSVARCCKVPVDILPARVNQHVSIIRPVPTEWDFQYLMYYFISPRMQAYLLSIAGSGGTRNALTKELIQRFEIPRPEIQEQIRIGAALSAYDYLIDNNLRRIKLLEESARLLYEEWFVRLRFPGHEHTRTVKGLPEGWERRELGEICNEVRELIAPQEVDPETPYIGLEHMPRRSITLSTWGNAEEVTSSKHRFRAGDVLFGKIRPYFHKVGFTLVNGVASSDAIVLRPKEDRLASLTLMVVSSDRFVAEASQKMKEGSKMPRADWKIMREFPVLLPSDSIHEEFDGFVAPITRQLRLLAMQNLNLRRARDILLPKLMSGEIEV